MPLLEVAVCGLQTLDQSAGHALVQWHLSFVLKVKL